MPIPAAPVRIVHLGLGAFARAHQAWYTARVDDHREWGIAAFTGRSATAAEQLAPQDGLFTVVERSAAGDDVAVVGSIVEVRDGADVGRLVELLAAPSTAVVTLTITEAGYRLRVDGAPDLEDPAVAADLRVLAAAMADPGARIDQATAPPVTALGRLVLGLVARSRSGAGPIAVVPCDNIPDNGPLVRRGVLALTQAVAPAAAAWIAQNVSYVSTSVDRITPRTTTADIAEVAARTGWVDSAPVVTEPFHDWILSGSFPAGRPEWERAGARFVDDIVPFERRKLWLLNGAHSLMAYAGLARGHTTVAEAIGDGVVRAEVLGLWAEASAHLPAELLELDRYLADLLARFENARIEHRLAQIAVDGVAKLRVRVVPVALAERAGGRSAAACADVVGAWVGLVRLGREPADAHADAISIANRGVDPIRELVALLSPELADDEQFVDRVRDVAGRTME
ncbi:mannitol dehydrogenase family protein [Microbacterium jejuense]|uniref:Mannitol dehydrogenase family protein n=2 Tax=Microbacterium jejuense TaxID=1263637 RepID=A0ABS7HRS5_9MICO|nr:mannitol dehydrogenase family protein [Microbacterium jejuense]